MKLLFIIAAGLSLSAVACASAGVSSVAETTPVVEAPAVATTEPVTPVAEAPLPTPTTVPDAKPVSLEGAFTYYEMSDYLDAIAPMVAQFYEEEYPDIPDPKLVYIPSGRATRGACGYSDSTAYEYCSGSGTIYVGQDLLWAFYDDAGDAAPAIALAHEWGHHIQNYRGVPFANTAAKSVEFENQADCLSGAWARYADEQGWLETEDDLDDVGRLMQFIGSSETSRRDHGTTAERSAAFESAYEDGATACNAFFPDEPVA
jgi:predicted metalloprotease